MEPIAIVRRASRKGGSQGRIARLDESPIWGKAVLPEWPLLGSVTPRYYLASMAIG